MTSPKDQRTGSVADETGTAAPRTAGVPEGYPRTPDGRYFVVNGRLWRLSNPDLDPKVRAVLVNELMAARRALREDGPKDEAQRRAAKQRVDAAKKALGERGPVWWDDGTPDLNRKMVANSPYAQWFATLTPPGNFTSSK